MTKSGTSVNTCGTTALESPDARNSTLSAPRDGWTSGTKVNEQAQLPSVSTRMLRSFLACLTSVGVMPDVGVVVVRLQGVRIRVWGLLGGGLAITQLTDDPHWSHET